LKPGYERMAMLVLMTGLAHAFLWEMFDDPAVRGRVWNMTGAAFRVELLGLAWVAFPSLPMRTVCLLMASFDVVVIGCTGAYLIAPWPIVPGQSCTSTIQMPLGVAASGLGLVVLLSIVRRRNE
jgi:hypothetical protein